MLFVDAGSIKSLYLANHAMCQVSIISHDILKVNYYLTERNRLGSLLLLNQEAIPATNPLDFSPINSWIDQCHSEQLGRESNEILAALLIHLRNAALATDMVQQELCVRLAAREQFNLIRLNGHVYNLQGYTLESDTPHLYSPNLHVNAPVSSALPYSAENSLGNRYVNTNNFYSVEAGIKSILDRMNHSSFFSGNPFLIGSSNIQQVVYISGQAGLQPTRIYIEEHGYVTPFSGWWNITPDMGINPLPPLALPAPPVIPAPPVPLAPQALPPVPAPPLPTPLPPGGGAGPSNSLPPGGGAGPSNSRSNLTSSDNFTGYTPEGFKYYEEHSKFILLLIEFLTKSNIGLFLDLFNNYGGFGWLRVALVIYKANEIFMWTLNIRIKIIKIINYLSKFKFW